MEFEAFPNTIKKKKGKYNHFLKIKVKRENKSKLSTISKWRSKMAQQLPSMPSNFKVQEQAKTKQPWHKLTSRGEKKRRERDTKTQTLEQNNPKTQGTIESNQQNPKHLQITIYASATNSNIENKFLTITMQCMITIGPSGFCLDKLDK